MCGFGELKEELEPGPRILFYSNDNEWVVAKEPLNRLFFPSGNPQMVLDYIRLPAEGSGPGLLFAKRVLQATNRSIGLIGIGSGLVITRIWDSAKGSEPPPPHIYDQMIQRVIEAGGYGKLKGMVWYQGEHVAVINPSASKVYEHNLLSFIDRVRRDTGNPELPIIVVHLCRYVTSTVPGMPGVSGGGETYSDLYATYAQAWEHVREAQRHAAQKRGNVYVVASLDCDPMVDPIHLNLERSSAWDGAWRRRPFPRFTSCPGTAHRSNSNQSKRSPCALTRPMQLCTGMRLPAFASARSLADCAAGRPSGFSLRFPEVGEDILKKGVPVIYATEFDPKDSASVLLRLTGDPGNLLKGVFGADLYYGAGLDLTATSSMIRTWRPRAFGSIALGLTGEVLRFQDARYRWAFTQTQSSLSPGPIE